ncbi:MAG: cytochrome b/b6 domain-containing protein [Comamonadaceae bacterium]|nr:cytochrome b/b6 domain-containing protein [Comamonadaceae bacterium]
MRPLTSTRLRIWDLPTRLFHWLLVASTVAMIVTAKMGGNAMEWHLRLGHVVLALLLFRLVWGVAGGHWSRFASFIPSPARLVRYLRGQGCAQDRAGHNPLGALSVLAMLGVLGAQVGTGLVSDDEIAFAGSLVRHVSGDTIAWATTWHKGWGQWLLYATLALHLIAIAYYSWFKKEKLVSAMLHGDKQGLPAELPASRDDLRAWISALCFAAASAVMAYWVWTRALY